MSTGPEGVEPSQVSEGSLPAPASERAPSVTMVDNNAVSRHANPTNCYHYPLIMFLHLLTLDCLLFSAGQQISEGGG